jgi:hypothetical protein
MYRHKKPSRGTTIIEVLVYTALFSMVMTGVAATFTAGNRWYATARAVITVEQDAHNVPYRVSQEMMESNLSAIAFYPSSASPYAVRGVVFVSPRNPAAGNAFGLNPLTGRARWYKYVCFYVAQDPQTPSALAVFRKEWVPSGFSADARPTRCVNDTTWFKNNNALRAQIVAHNVQPVTTTYPRGGFEVYSGDPETSSPNYETASNPICVVINTSSGSDQTQNTIKSNLLFSVRN